MTDPGSKGQPHFGGSDVVTLATYLSAVSNYAALVGNRVVGTASQRSTFAASFGFAPFRGLEFFELDGLNSYTHDGTQWLGTKTQSGNVIFNTGDLTASGGGFAGSKTINFVTGRFTVAPAVTLGVYTQAANDQHAGIFGVSSSSFGIYYWRANQAATTIAWSAVPTETG